MSDNRDNRRLALRDFYITHQGTPAERLLDKFLERFPDFSGDDMTDLAMDVADLRINMALSPDTAGSA